MNKTSPKLDPKELEFPDTLIVRDIENCVLQAIILQCLSKIEGIGLLEGTFIDHLLRRDQVERVRGILVEQDNKKPSVNIKVEVNVCYGISIPKKAEEIQTKIIEEITTLTGLHVASVHVIFKHLLLSDIDKEDMLPSTSSAISSRKMAVEKDVYDDYSDEF